MFKKIAFWGNLLLLITLSACSPKTEEAKNPFSIDISKYNILAQSSADYNSIDVYQLDKIIVIHAKSESEFFDGAQFVVKAQNDLSAEDVSITWTTLMGSTEKTEGNDRVIAEIKIEDNGTLIFHRKINFAKKAIDAVTDILIDRME
ncbi:hypothetical protein [Anaerotignum sp.]|uniref:hypothetical protein n=1 Tax=Anaerotignum sp. TaxID=2039241 RepID=UPI00289ECA73|nr:hypothetical protein [Anaerotignum sp.]